MVSRFLHFVYQFVYKIRSTIKKIQNEAAPVAAPAHRRHAPTIL